jgi:RHS repeat-associated protein
VPGRVPTRRHRLRPSGGRLESHDRRVVLDAPAGATAGELELSLDEVETDASLLLDGRPVRPLRHLRLEARRLDGRPFGGPFRRPLDLSVRYRRSDLRGLAGGSVGLYTREGPADPWTRVPAVQDREQRVLRAGLEHFSEYLLVAEIDAALQPTVDQYVTDLCFGAVTLDLPIELPPGTGGLTPRLTLSYSSTAAQGTVSDWHDTYERSQASWVGFGWSLGPGYIEMDGDRTSRLRARLVRDGRSHELIKVSQPSANRSEWVTQEQTFAKIWRRVTFDGAGRDYFEIQDRDGTLYRYGYDVGPGHLNDSRQDAPWSWSGVGWEVDWHPHRYYLDQIVDLDGNLIRIRYVNDLGNRVGDRLTGRRQTLAVYPERIEYSLNAPGGPHRIVRLVSEARTDDLVGPVVDDQAGPVPDGSGAHRLLQETRLLRRIEVYVADPVIPPLPQRSYRLGYRYQPCGSGDGQQFAVLASLTEISDVDGSSRPTIRFEYEPKPAWIEGGDARSCTVPLLARVDNGAGGTVSYTYVPFGCAAYGGPPASRLQHWTLALETRADAWGGEHVTTYRPELGRGPNPGPLAGWTTKFTDPRYPVFRGFQVVRVGEVDREHLHVFFRGLTTVGENEYRVYRPTGFADYVDDEPFKGKEIEVLHFAPGGGEPLAREWCMYTWAYESRGGDFRPPPAVLPADEDHRDWYAYRVAKLEEVRVWGSDTNGSAWTKRIFGHDAYGNVTLQQDWSSEAGVPGAPLRTRVWSYRPLDDGVRYVVDRLSEELVVDRSGRPVARTQLLYDGRTQHDQGVGSRGRLTGVRRYLLGEDGSALTQDTRLGYDAYGNVGTVTRYGNYGGGPGNPPAFLSPVAPRTTTIAYEPTGTFPATITYPGGTSEAIAHDPVCGQVRTFRDRGLKTSSWIHDRLGRLISATGPLHPDGIQRELRIAYLAPDPDLGRPAGVELLARSDAGGPRSWQATYRYFDGFGRPIQEHSAADAVGQRVAVNRRYDHRGRLTDQSVPHVAQEVTAAGFDRSDWSAWSAPATRYGRDALGRLTAVLPPDGAPGPWVEYAEGGLTATVHDANGQATTTRRDSFGRVLSVRDAAGVETTYQHDVLDRLTAIVPADGLVTKLEYDWLGRRTRLIDPDAGTSSYYYDSRDNLIWSVDGAGVQTELTYDHLDRLVGVWYPIGWAEPLTEKEWATVYDLMELRGALDANAAAVGATVGGWTDTAIVAGQACPVRCVHYNEVLARVETLCAAAGLGAPGMSAAWPLSAAAQCGSGHLGELRRALETYERQLPMLSRDRARVVIAYDALDRPTDMWDGSGRTSWSYDASGRTTGETRLIDGFAYRTDYTYDSLDRVRTVSYPVDDGAPRETLSYRYGPSGNLDRLTSSRGEVLVDAVAYNALGLPTEYRLGPPGSARATHSYWGSDLGAGGGPHGALRDLALTAGGGGMLVARHHRLDPLGSPRQIVDHHPSVGGAWEFEYDGLDRLTRARLNGGDLESYGYPANEQGYGNLAWKQRTPEQGTLAYGNAAHRHAATAYGYATYAYDAAGQLTVRAAPATGVDRFTFDGAGRLLRVARNGRTTCRYAYAGDGRRAKRLDLDGVVHYSGPGCEVNLGDGSADAVPVATRHYQAPLGAAGERWVATRRAGTLYRVQTDHLGSPMVIGTGSLDGQSTQQPRYTPFGERLDGASEMPTDRGFAGYTWDAQSRLYHCGARYYDPVLGRFVSPDPVMGEPGDVQTMNPYSYCLNNPLVYTDRDGQAAIATPLMRPPTVIVDPIPPQVSPGPWIFTGFQGRIGPLITTGIERVSPIRIAVPNRRGVGDWTRITVAERDVGPRIYVAESGSIPPPGRIFDRYVIFLGRRVYQQKIHWHLKDHRGLTGLQRAKQGRPPVGLDGLAMNLHHILQEEPGPMAEVTATAHRKGDGLLHRLIARGYSFRKNTELNERAIDYQREYWKWRALTANDEE